MTHIVAERLYRRRDDTPVIARIFAPVRAPLGHEVARPSEWLCWIEIRGLETPIRDRAIGVDSFQALALGLYTVSSHLEKHAATLRFSNGPEGNTATHLMIEWPFGSEGKADIERYVQIKFKEELERRRRRKEQNRPT